jgi:hypothetical protein
MWAVKRSMKAHNLHLAIEEQWGIAVQRSTTATTGFRWNPVKFPWYW